MAEEWPRTGSHIRRDVALWSLPFDKSYAELTAEQKQKLRASYDTLDERDEPPFPLEGMGAIVGPIAEAQQVMLQRGRIFAIATVDANGDVQRVTFRERPNDDTAKVVGWILVRTKFKPALCKGTPCAMEYPVQFELKVR